MAASIAVISAVFVFLSRGLPYVSTTRLHLTSEKSDTLFLHGGQPFSLNCHITGAPVQNISWYHNGTIVQPSTDRYVNKKGQLYFPTGLPNGFGNGIYQCILHSTVGSLLGQKIHVELIYLRKVSLAQSFTGQSSITRLKCNVVANHHVNITWYKDDKVITMASRTISFPNGVLQIRGYNAADDGQYACAAQTGDDVITSNTLRVNGTAVGSKRNGVLVFPTKAVTTSIGNQLLLECYYFGANLGYNKSDLHWRKISSPELSDRRFGQGRNVVNRIIMAVQASDAGEYACESSGGAQEKLLVTVQVSPKFSRKLPPSKSLYKGGELKLKCEATGNPVPMVTWFKDGQRLVESVRVHLKGSELTVSHVTLSDKGVYQCEAENSLGSSLSYLVLNVADGKFHSRLTLYADPISSSKIKLNWTIPAVPEGEKTYSVHYRNVVDKAEIQTLVFKQHHTLNDLRPFTTYKIYVRLYITDSGTLITRKESNVMKVTTYEKVPERAPILVKLKSYTHGTLDVSWLPPDHYYRNGIIVGYNVTYLRKNGREQNLSHAGKDVYTITLKDLKIGVYEVKVAARTKLGCGPFSAPMTASVLGKYPAKKTLPAPAITTKYLNTTLVVSVKSPITRDVTGYLLAYRNIMDTNEQTRTMRINGSTFNQILPRLEVNSEYVINVTARGIGNEYGRPAIVVIETRRELPNGDKTEVSNQTNIIPPMGITCRYSKDFTALILTWQKPPFKRATQYHIKYCAKDRPNHCKIISTTSFNATLANLLPGNVYEIEMTSSVRDGATTYVSQIVKPERTCALPEKVPGSPPSNFECAFDQQEKKMIVQWQPPTMPNGRIKEYHIVLNDSLGGSQASNIPTGGSIDVYTKYLKNVRWNMKYNISIYARNAVGSSPLAHCSVDTFPVTEAPAETTRKPTAATPKKNNHGNSDDDIKLGIIIGCVISLLFVLALAVFVLWSDPCRCRTHKPLLSTDSDTSSQSQQHCKNRMSKPDTISTEVSDASSKHYQVLQKYYLEEASKESDRGLGMTPKNSHLCLDTEKVPFLQKAPQNDYSADGSFDSQDSGIQGFNKLDKGSSSSSTITKDAQHYQRRFSSGVVETVC